VARLREQEAQLGRVDAYLAQLDGQDTARYDVVVRQIAPGLVASVRAWIAAKPHEEPGEGQDEEQEAVDAVEVIFEELEQYIARFKARAALPPAIVYHDSEYRADGQDLEIVVPLTSAIPATEQIQVYELPGCEAMACLIHNGSYERLAQTFGALLQWIELNNYVIAGPTREVFLRFGANQEGYALAESYVTAQGEEFVTELQVPIVKG
jgi:effector-binding domain-containing protein